MKKVYLFVVLLYCCFNEIKVESKKLTHQALKAFSARSAHGIPWKHNSREICGCTRAFVALSTTDYY